MNLATVQTILFRWLRDASAWQAHPTAASETAIISCPSPCIAPAIVNLRPGQVFRLTKDTGIQSLEIHHGTVWLTSTPARNDILLRPGDRLPLSDHWPFVLQAMESAQLTLLPRASR
jgi:hypothetical protein